ncbi:MAG: UbiA family prenyltransferase [Bradyrhizobium sp.]|nr:UbiA family prenyltransferase [Bradyrhizobium sp.]
MRNPLSAPLPGGVPLVVDLETGLLRCNLLAETFFAVLGREPAAVFAMARASLGGKAALKAHLYDQARPDPATLPYAEGVLALIRSAKQEGRQVYIVSDQDARLAGLVADHFGVLSELPGAGGGERAESASGTKSGRLPARFGKDGFEYVGSDRDSELASLARTCLVPGLLASNPRSSANVVPLATERASLGQWLALLRPHQYVKNALVFVPLVTSHRFSLEAVITCILAFAAFSLCASAVYIVNDLVDVQADRHHPKKRSRPLASGALPAWPAAALSLVLLAAAAAISLSISLPFAGTLAGYFALTTAYTFVLKRKMLVDVVVLSLLYSVRVIGGGVAISVTVSEWLLAFSMFIFTTLALLKRYVELTRRLDVGMVDPGNRNYRVDDISVVAALAAAAGFNAVTVFALYISSESARQLYAHPQVLWLICPLLMYWIGRALLMAHRRYMDDDPIVFAIKDRPSLFILGLVVALVLLAA